MKIPKTFSERLFERIVEKQWEQKDVYQHKLASTGARITKGNMHHWKKGEGISSAKLNLLSQILKVNSQWLHEGVGPKEIYENLVIESEYKIGYMYVYPVMSWEDIKEGSIMDGSDEPISTFRSDHQGDCFALIVNNESMVPEFKEGEQILIDTLAKVKNGDYCIITLEDSSHVLRQYVEDGKDKFIKVINPEYPNRIKPLEKGMLIMGKVVEARRIYT